MSFYSDVQPGKPFRPSASLSNDVRHLLNRMNGFGGGVNPAGNPGIVRIPVYNSTSAVLSEGKAVSIDISGIVAGECYPAIAFSDEMPCYGVLAKDLNPAEVCDCILSGLAVVQITSTPATGNYATPGTGGVFMRGDEGVPIVNVSSTSAVVMLGAVKTSGGSSSVVLGFPDLANGTSYSANTEHTATNNCWVLASASLSSWSNGTGNVYLQLSFPPNYTTTQMYPVTQIEGISGANLSASGTVFIPVSSGIKFKYVFTSSGSVSSMIPSDFIMFPCL